MLKIGRVHRARRPEHDRDLALGPRGDGPQGLKQERRVVIDSADALSLNSSGTSRVMASRFSITYEMPDGVRTLSSSTRQPPSPPRTRSQPETWQYTPPGGRTPCTGRANWGRLMTSDHGTTPARTISWAYDVVDERVQCPDPLCQPSLDPCPLGRGEDRGTRSSGQARSRRAPSPAGTSNVMPCCMKIVSRRRPAAWRRSDPRRGAQPGARRRVEAASRRHQSAHRSIPGGRCSPRAGPRPALS